MVELKPEKADLFSAHRHPWIFSGAIKKVTGDLSPDEPVAVCGKNREIIGWGFYSPQSRIALRMLSFGAEKPSNHWLEERLYRAREMRKALWINSDAYRLVNSEGDNLPGLVIDVYNRTVVVRPMIRAMECKLPELAFILTRILPGCRIYIKRDEHSARTEGITCKNGFYPEGEGHEKPETIKENGIAFLVDIREGQKTGFYIDQRRNRELVRELATGRRVLNCFCYTGGFSLYAAAGGALEVVSVDASQGALDLAEKNLTLNPELGSCPHKWIKADVLEYLKGDIREDLIILDPPPFARKRSDLAGALKGYGFINTQAMAKIPPGGFLLTFSCSGAMDKATFLKMLHKAGMKSGRNIRMVRELHGTEDHPFSLNHPEGEYLKGWLLYVE